MAQQSTSSRGWNVTSAALGINLVLGVLYAWSVMKKALVTQWHWSNTDAAWPFTASTIAFSIMMIFAGRMQDKTGPKKIAILGGIILGLALIASAWATTPLTMVIVFGIIGGMGIGLGYSATTPPCLKWFPPAKKGLIAGIVVSGIGLAAVIWAPTTQFLLGRTKSIPTTFIILGIITIVVVSILSNLLVNPPAGYVPAAAAPAGGATAKRAPAGRRDMDWYEVIRTAAFWKLWIIMVLSASAGLMIIVHIATIAKDLKIEAGFFFVALVAIFNTLGRLVGGSCSDKIGRTNTMVLFFTLQAVNMFFFSHYTTPGLLMFGAAFTGICYGTIFPLFPAATADFYGIKNLGVNYGLVFTAFGVAGTVGPILAGLIRDKTGGYTGAYLTCAAMLILAVVMAFTTKPPKAEPAVAAAPASAGKRSGHKEKVKV